MAVVRPRAATRAGGPSHNASVRAEQLSILWLGGPPGAGKSAVGWAIYDELVSSGARAGFVDIDQLGMCLPAPAADPERYRLKLRNLAAVAASFSAAGCEALIMPGHLGVAPALSARTIDGAVLTACRLRASPDELRRRLTARRAANLVTASLRDAAALDQSSSADPCIHTDGLTVAEVARLVRDRCGGWPPEHAASPQADQSTPQSTPASGPIPPSVSAPPPGRPSGPTPLSTPPSGSISPPCAALPAWCTSPTERPDESMLKTYSG